METNDFASGMAQLLTLATEQPTAIMCSESVWWKCHRRLVSDHLVLIEHIPVLHVMHTGKLNEHPPLAEARVEETIWCTTSARWGCDVGTIRSHG